MITLDKLTKVFETANGPVTAADHVSMEVPEGEICILLGPSGCGKTTALKMINRLIPKTSGKIFINGRDTDEQNVTELRRGIGYVIQQIGLFPNMTIVDNICVVPDMLGWDRAKSRKRAMELLEMVNLDPAVFANRFPKELSGGQQQRVGVVRALAADPPVMLMDEPFGAIDPINREVIQDEFLKLQKEFRKTIMFVSHDIDEAVKMGDKVAIFRAGKLEQFDSPDNVLAHPANPFIADFVGSDRTLKRLRLVTVGQAMFDAPAVTEDDTLDRAAGVMRDLDHDFVVVTDRHGRPDGYVRQAVAEAKHGTIAEHHARLPVTVEAGQDLRTAVSQMFTHDVTWLAVTDSQGRYQGVVTQQGITHLLGKTYGAAATAGTAAAAE
ncbi:L-proline glycine betaine ABC transport system permease protein ProV [Caenispirillum salinarum AK4]|uniref:Quaternary amine transport ATP-binding protein n=1 Tax=Caenispirillum salinarum AK4 TaxID=1238182 RepID=K9HUD9_9PROT|nr:ABC transporter ATP-binding protein [Caenispirillum salinarum]EKV31866.1 L-proline glycine betaine ABC transport system permease protein ProV [Caenispirillum salinarum AK4]